MSVHTHLRVIGSMESAYTTGIGFSQRSLIICPALVFQHTSEFHYLSRNNTVCTVSAKELIGIPGTPHSSLVVQSRLESKLHSLLELVLMSFADFDNIAGHLMAHNSGMLCHIFMHSLMIHA